MVLEDRDDTFEFQYSVDLTRFRDFSNIICDYLLFYQFIRMISSEDHVDKK